MAIHGAIVRFDFAVQSLSEAKSSGVPEDQREPLWMEYHLAKANLQETIERAKFRRKDR